MNVFPEFDVTELGALKLGEIVGVMDADGFSIGLSVRDPDGEGCLVLGLTSAGAPRLRNPIKDRVGSIMTFKDARVAVDFSKSAMLVPNATDQAGHFVLFRGEPYVFGHVSSTKCVVFGFNHGQSHVANCAFAFPRWSIETRDEDGSWKTLAAFDFAAKV